MNGTGSSALVFYTDPPNSTDTSRQPSTGEKPCILETLQILLITGYALVLIVGLLGNLVIVIVFWPNWRKGPIIDLLILYLAFFDLLSSTFGPFVFLYWILTCYKTWHFGEIGCKILPVLSRIFTNISIGIILIMAIDRCRVIVTPFKGRFSRRTIHTVVILTIILSITVEGNYINGLYMQDGRCVVKSVAEPSFSYPLVILTALRNIAFIVIFSVTIALIYRKLYTESTDKLLAESYCSASVLERRQRVMKMLVVMAIVFSVMVMPRDILHFTYTISWLKDANNGIPTSQVVLPNNILKLIQVGNSITNVFIYGKMHAQFWHNVQVSLLCKDGKRYIPTESRISNAQDWKRSSRKRSSQLGRMNSKSGRHAEVTNI